MNIIRQSDILNLFQHGTPFDIAHEFIPACHGVLIGLFNNRIALQILFARIGFGGGKYDNGKLWIALLITSTLAQRAVLTAA